MKKRFLAFFLACIMVLGLVPVNTVFAFSDTDQIVTVEKYDEDGNGTFLLMPTRVARSTTSYAYRWIQNAVGSGKISIEDYSYITAYVDADQDDGWLNNGDILDSSKWLASVNGTVYDDVSYFYGSEIDVLRIVFSPSGTGSEFGLRDAGYFDKGSMAVNKDALVELVSRYTADDFTDGTAQAAAYQTALDTILDLDATAAEVSAAKTGFENSLSASATGIALSPESLTVLIGRTNTATATLTPSTATDTITWTIADETIATVDQSGIVTGVAAGTTTLTAKVSDTVSAAIPVTVKAIGVTGIQLADVTMNERDIRQLTAVVEPEDATDTVTWSVADETIAAITKDGTVTALKAGTTTVTAAAGDVSKTANLTVTAGSYIYFAYSDGRENQYMAADGSFTLGSLDQGYFRVANTSDTAWWENEEKIDAGWGSVTYHWYVDRETGEWQPSGQQPAKPITVTAGSFTKSFTINYEATSGVTELKTYINGTEVTDDAPYEVTGCVSNVAVTTKGLKNGAWVDIPVQALRYDTSDNVYYHFRFVGNALEINRAGSATMTVSLKGESVSTTFKVICNPVLATAMRVVVPETAEIGDWDAVPNQYVGLRPYTGFDIEFTPANATNRDVTWTALTPDIAEYSDLHSAGIVPKKAGTAKFTVTNTTDPNLSQEVIVTFGYKNPLTGASVNDLTMDPGNEQALTVAVTPSNATEQRFTWTYSQDGIVEVTDEIKTSEDGITAWTVHSIKALKAGTVTVTGTPWDSTGGCENITFTVTVKGNTPPAAVSADWPSFRGNDYNNGITSAETPRDAEETELKWVQQISTGWSDTPSPMILVDDTVVTMAGSTLKKLSVTDGSTVASAAMDAATSWGSTPPFYADGYIFCQLGGGKVQAFNAETLESLWVYTDENGGQGQSPIAYSDGMVYVGFGYGREYAFVCLNANDGSLVWREVDSQGYYWAGAVVAGDYVICGNENGTVTSRNKLTGDLISELSVGEKVRSSICYDGGRIFFTAYNAQLCWADLNTGTGELTNLTKVDCSAYGTNSTSTPVVYNGIAYIGVGSWSGNKSIVAVNVSTGSVLWNIDEPAYPQCSVLLSAAYADDGYVYLYVTYNSNPGGINVIKAKADGSEAAQEVLYNPSSDYQNYCICSVIAGSDGTLYYKNDTGCIFALSKIQSQTDADVENVISLINAIGTPVTLESESAITAARTGCDALTDAQKAQVTNYDVLVAAEEALAALKQPAAPETIQVSFEVLGDSAHGEDGDVHTLSGNNLEVWVAENTYTVDADATVWDLAALVLDENEITYSNPTGNYLVSLTRDGVTLGEFTNGNLSGWMYTLNGKHPNQGMDQQTLADGDTVVLHYTDDYTRENGRIPVDEPIPAKDTDPEKIYRETGDLLAGQDDSLFVFGSEWVALGLARSGREVPDGYYESLVEYVEANIDENGRLSRTKSTENSRLILALTALGYDVTDVGGHNLLEGLTDMTYVKKQGINGPVWALIAFDSHNYEIPAGDVTREKLIDVILTEQLADGGWAFGGASDADMTGMALQALAPYYNTNPKVKAAVDKAIAALSDMQMEDGSFYTYDTDGSTYPSAESIAQVVVALTALGINPETDARFVKNGISAVDALCAYAVEGGGFRHLAGGDWNGMATEQGYYALASYFRLLGGKTSLYDMSDVTIRINSTEPEKPAVPEQPTNPSDPGKPGSSTDSPQTGDEFHVMLWTALTVTGMLGIAILLLISGKRKYTDKYSK